MSEHIRMIARNLPVAPFLWALQSHPELWNEHPERTQDPASPHHGLDDIWLRYADPSVAMQDGPHESVWYPGASLVPIAEIIDPLMQYVGGEKLGGVLVTRIPAGAECKPHADHGWHAREYEKFAIQIQSAPGQRFCFEDGSLETMPGDLFWFDNAYSHWVTNDTPHDRITLIVCIKTRKVN
jgi:hypothetical protein